MAPLRTFVRASLLPMLFGAGGGAARAQDVDVDIHGYAQAGLVRTPGDLGTADGGYGKLAQGGARSEVEPQFAAGLIEATADLPWDLGALVDVQYGPKQKSPVDLTTASLHWQPPAEGAWRWSAKLGAFFPPFGLENRDIGWSSPWTLTPSTLASWVGEELRTVGSEGTIAWVDGGNSVALTAAVYGWNDPAGVALATRGWDLGQQPTGLFGHVRLPNGLAPHYTPEFKENDDTPGWYAGLAWQNAALGRLQVYRYDNEADPGAERHEVYAWHTRFWDAAYTKGWGPFYVIAEGIVGDTPRQPRRCRAVRYRFPQRLCAGRLDPGRLAPGPAPGAVRHQRFRRRTWPLADGDGQLAAEGLVAAVGGTGRRRFGQPRPCSRRVAGPSGRRRAAVGRQAVVLTVCFATARPDGTAPRPECDSRG